MKTALRLFLLIVLLMTVLGTVAAIGALQWLAAHDTVRLFVDGQQVKVNVVGDLPWLPVAAALALALFIVFLIVPLAVLLALLVAGAASLISLLAALSPLLLLGALAWWIIRRQTPKPVPPAPAPTPQRE